MFPRAANTVGDGPLDRAATRNAEPTYCDLCGEDLRPNELTQAALDASGLNICTPCIEAILQ